MGRRSLSSRDPAFAELLSGYLDGELPENQQAAVEQCLLDEPEAGLALEQLLRTRELLRTSYAQELAQVDLSGLWDAIEPRLEARAEGVVRPLAAPSPGILERIKTWWEALGFAPVALSAGFAALLVVGIWQLMPEGERSGAGGAGPVAKVEATPPAAAQPVPGGEAQADATGGLITEGVQVNEVQGGAASTVMVLSSPENATIIWVNEDEGEGSAI